MITYFLIDSFRDVHDRSGPVSLEDEPILSDFLSEDDITLEDVENLLKNRSDLVEVESHSTENRIDSDVYLKTAMSSCGFRVTYRNLQEKALLSSLLKVCTVFCPRR